MSPTDPTPPEATAPAATPEDLLALHRDHGLAGRLAGGGFISRRLRAWLTRLLEPLVAHQSTWNAAAARLGSRQWEQTVALGQVQIEHGRQIADLRHDLAHHTERSAASLQAVRVELLDYLQALNRETQALRDEVVTAERRRERSLSALGDSLEGSIAESLDRQQEALGRLRDAVLEQTRSFAREGEARWQREALKLEQRLQDALAGLKVPGPAGPPAPSPLARDAQDAFYAALEDAFRGSPSEVRGRLGHYIPRLRAVLSGDGRDRILDLGSGRGEWLDLLREDGISAQGVDGNAAFVARCRSRGLDVRQGDALAALADCPDASLSAVTAFHLVEHLPFELVIRLFDLAHRALRPGGLLLLETPNPANLLVASHSFHLDPTHLRPLPGEVLRFVAEQRGYAAVEVLPLNPFPEAARFRAADPELGERLNQLFFGPRDYALLARKG